MSQSSHIWEKEAFLGSTILYSNSNKNHFYVIFAGAEKLKTPLQYKVHFIYAFHSVLDAVGQHYISPSTSNMIVVVKQGESIRFAKHLGINVEMTIPYGPEEFGSHCRFFPIRQLKFLEIETDYIRYELHSI